MLMRSRRKPVGTSPPPYNAIHGLVKVAAYRLCIPTIKLQFIRLDNEDKPLACPGRNFAPNPVSVSMDEATTGYLLID